MRENLKKFNEILIKKMKILSSFHDYYDGLMSHDANEYHYIRNSHTLELPNQQWHSKTLISPFGDFDSKYEYFLATQYQEYIVKFCKEIDFLSEWLIFGVSGKLYLFIRSYDKQHTEKVKLFTSLETYENDNTVYHYSKHFSVFATKTIHEWMTIYNNHPNNIDVFVGLKTPIFIIERKHRNLELTINPCLVKYGLQAFFNIHTIFQEIEQFCMNSLTNNPTPPCIMTDELRRDSKGFDKHSFKKEKEKSK